MSTELIKLLSPATMQSLAWALLHFLWQGTALAAVAGALMAFSRRAQVRYAVGIVALVAMLATPLVTFMISAERSMSVRESSTLVPHVAISAVGQRQAFPGYEATPQRPSLNALPWLVEAWLLGIVFFSLRSAGGFFLIERERRRQSIVVADRVLEICFELQDHLRYYSSHRVLRMRMATDPGRDWLVPSNRISAGNGADRTFAGAVANGGGARTRAHSPPRSVRECFSGLCGNRPFLSPGGLVAEQAHSR
jgi:bla regulator protein blaR1